MGFLDFFRKSKEPIEPAPRVLQVEKNKIERTITRNGEIQIDFYRRTHDVRKDYDSTRLVISNKLPEYMYKSNVYDCKVSWYCESDAMMIDENDSRHDFKDIKLTVDPYLLQTDNAYATCLMYALLDKARVNDMLARGMVDNPDNPCGNYVGSVIFKDGNYVKNFNRDIGRAVHNSKEMAQKRSVYQAEQRKKVEERKSEIRSQQLKLQEELDKLDGKSL